MLGLGVIIVLVLLAAFAGVIARLIGHGPNDVYDYMTDDFGIPKGPNSHFWFGADGSAATSSCACSTVRAPRCSSAVAPPSSR